MRIRILDRGAISFLLCVLLAGAAGARAQGIESPRAPDQAAAPASPRKILSKNPEYLKLLNPPTGDDFLRAYSGGYQKRAAEIEAQLADAADEKERAQKRADEWAKVTRNEHNQFQYAADVALNAARTSFSQAHPDAWFEIGRGTYEESAGAYVIRSTPTAPVDMHFSVPMKPAALTQMHEAFHKIASQEIDREAHEYVAQSGANSSCARNSDWCFQFKSNEIEQSLRSMRIVVVAQGSLEQRKLDRLLVVDFESEGILLELDPHVPILNPVAWRFSIGDVPKPIVEPEPALATPQPEPATPAAPLGTEKQGAGEPAPNPPNAPAPPAARIVVPANVEAASIISRTTPAYPPEARAGLIHGDVVLRAVIDKEGKISEVRVLDGNDVLAKAAIEAVRQWRYKPMLSDGQPTEVETTITITFSLAE
jgi:TonB family protein